MSTSEPNFDLNNNRSDRQVASQDKAGKPGKLAQTKAKKINSVLQPVALPASQMPEIDQHQAKTHNFDWLTGSPSSQRLLIAAIHPNNFTLTHANETFCRLTGTDTHTLETKPTQLTEIFADFDTPQENRLYRQHLICQIFKQLYHLNFTDPVELEEPLTVTVQSPLYREPRYIQFWLESHLLKISRLNSIDEFADLQPVSYPGKKNGKFYHVLPNLSSLENRLKLENYHIEGHFLLVGFDITPQETQRRLIQLLIQRDSILRPSKFSKINRHLRSLFRAQNTVVLSIERDKAQIFLGNISDKLNPTTYPMQSLRGSHFLRAAKANQVLNIADLAADCQTECERTLLQMGVRSMLLIPLVIKATDSTPSTGQLAGLVGLTSDRPNNFNSTDSQNAETLIPAFLAALRSAIQQRVTTLHNIHPAVEWRFLQEAERRSWGLPPEPIVFNDVYPLYGISDIRGSSEERNRAIQADLIEQFRLAIAIVTAVCNNQKTSLGEQLKIDLKEYAEKLQEEVTVDAEVTATQYLKEQVEIYFDYFASCGEEAQQAVETYRQHCANEHECVYVARAHYDQTINQINMLLRETWERWQGRMQEITPHYCDVEFTDGIDHMIYAGASIDPKFTPFHLRSLRYEQLRALCDCARTAFKIQDQYSTKMQVTHLVLVQDSTVDIFHDEQTDNLFDVRGTRDTRYEIVKKRIDKGVESHSQTRITQPGMLTVVYSTDGEYGQYQEYLRYLAREGWVESEIECGMVEPLQGVSGLRFARVRVLPASEI
ncbi:GAF domain-containing protein [Ancylothrix sp. C2]|uniref:GAF domain-containing protein n=1 Tax=Ancylothrix sp. D3o TaxID=2953691 RepID=UPI0021BAA540|nr:GAF domain-containing protein [Ancylothrix sp. D3o]MCT7948526.1 GAF domain-containing protein [Ancylothrix sp. D3o]